MSALVAQIHRNFSIPRSYWLIYNSWRQHDISVSALMHERPSGFFSKSRGLSASTSFLPLFGSLYSSCGNSLLMNPMKTLAMQTIQSVVVLIVGNCISFVCFLFWTSGFYVCMTKMWMGGWNKNVFALFH